MTTPTLRRQPFFSTCFRQAAPLLLLAASLAACNSIDAGDGTLDVDALPQLVAQEELRIGSLDDPDAGFSQIGGVAVDEDGFVYVLERQAMEVRVFDAGGTRVREFGRPGEGPGEFGFPMSIGLLADTVWVTDMRLQRISLFTRDGRYLDGLKPPEIQLGGNEGWQLSLVASGLRSDGWFNTGYRMMMSMDAPKDSLTVPVGRMDRTGTIVDTLWTTRTPPPGTAQRIGGQFAGVPRVSMGPLHHAALAAVLTVERPVADASPAEFIVHRVTFDGDTVFRRAFRYQPVAYDDAVVDRLIEAPLKSLVDRGVTEATARQGLLDLLELPANQPPISTARMGEDESLWLRREEGGETHRWIVLRADGTVRGSLELPRRANLHWVSGDVAWASVLDELDVPWLVKYRVAEVKR